MELSHGRWIAPLTELVRIRAPHVTMGSDVLAAALGREADPARFALEAAASRPDPLASIVELMARELVDIAAASGSLVWTRRDTGETLFAWAIAAASGRHAAALDLY